MSRCDRCGYYWADCDEKGETLSLNYCHFVGPEGWAPCEAEEQYGYESFIEDEEHWTHEFGQPYDYGDDYWI